MTALAACSGNGPEAAPEPAGPAEVSFSVKEAAKGLKPSDTIEVAAVAATGKLDTVTVKSADGKQTLTGELDENGVWRNKGELALDTTYKIVASATNPDGVATQLTRTFSTLRPKIDATYRVLPDGSTVGVGMPVMVTFDSPVQTEEMRAEVEKRMKITTTPKTEGSWGWVDSTQLMWRPKSYWKPGTKVSVNAPLVGVQTGESKWIRENKGGDFTISKRARIVRVDLANHYMTVRDNGKVTASYPISAGQRTPSWETRSGVKIITEKQDHLVMDAATLGVPEDDPNYYRLDVRHAMRVTNTGEFFHGAPWSVGSQGRANVSHGCVNMSPRAAAEFFNSTVVGDVTEFVGSGRQMKIGDGVPVWLFSYDNWKARSAIAKLAKEKAKKDAEKKAAAAKARAKASTAASAAQEGTPAPTQAPSTPQPPTPSASSSSAPVATAFR
ncbi:MAG: Ig-like domain-containing protein [Dermatophilus congolensis]|nr:Ig-like domain-containing protein [Dermatophilus congolensis]